MCVGENSKVYFRVPSIRDKHSNYMLLKEDHKKEHDFAASATELVTRLWPALVRVSLLSHGTSIPQVSRGGGGEGNFGQEAMTGH
jgi:hypothetical protein